MNIYGKIVKLRAIEPEDLDLLRDMINDPKLERLIVGHSFPTSKLQQQNWYNKLSEDQRNLRLIIETKEDGAIGFANIVDIDWVNRTAFHGIKIAKQTNRGKGIGTDTVMAVMKYCFEELQLKRLESTIVSYNKASLKLYTERCGWQQEGTKREAVFKNGKFCDLNIVGILKEDYFNLIKENKYWN